MSVAGGYRNSVSRFVAQKGSVQSAYKSMKKSQIPTDVGILPGTLIQPLNHHKPSWFSRATFTDRFKIQMTILLGPLKNVITQYTQRDPPDPVTGKKAPINLKLAERYYIARNLHRRLYKAIAEGNRTEIEKIACSGAQRQAMTRLDDRKINRQPAQRWSIDYRGYTPKGEMETGFWAWFKHVFVPPSLKSTRMISDQIVPVLPGVKLRQAVVQIKARQTLDKKNGQPAKAMNTDEYVVIQQFIKDGQAEDWMIWGTTGRSTMTEVNEVLDQERTAKLSRSSFWSKVQENSERMGGGVM